MPLPRSVSRTSPAYWHEELVIGAGNLMVSDLSGAFEVGIDARTGAMLWRTKTDASRRRDWPDQWSFPSGGAIWSGAAIVDGSGYWGSGYDTRARNCRMMLITTSSTPLRWAGRAEVARHTALSSLTVR